MPNPNSADPNPNLTIDSPDTESAQPPNDTKQPTSENRQHANRENAKNSTGPKTAEGKARSALNATRHGILSQTIHLPEAEMAVFTAFTATYVAGLSPVGPVETELAHACADLQFRLHRLAAAEHNLFAIGHTENGAKWDVQNSDSHAALTFAETIRRSKDPLATLTIYETRLSRRFLQTLKQLREIQAERKALEQQQLREMYQIALRNPGQGALLEPAGLGFVCSSHDWNLFYQRSRLLGTGQAHRKTSPKPPASRETLENVA